MLEVVEVSTGQIEGAKLEQVTFSLPKASVGIIIGPDEEGRAVMLQCIAGLVPYSGQIRIRGIENGELEAKKQLVYVPSQPELYEALTVKEHLGFMEMAYGVSSSEQEKGELLLRFGLSEEKDRLCSELSAEKKKKTALCGALIVKPALLLLDDPAAGLAEEDIRELRFCLATGKEAGRSVLISSHSVDVAQDIWDQAFIMEQGKI